MFTDRALAIESPGSADKSAIQHAIWIGGARVQDGSAYIADAPGFGIDMDWQQRARCRA